MRTGRPKATLELSESEQRTLESWTRRRKTAQALARRARIVLLCATGKNNGQVAETLKVSPGMVGKWRRRFRGRSDRGNARRTPSWGPRKVGDEDVERVLTMTLETTPRGATHWSTRSLAKKCGMSQSTVSRIWRAFALQPHRTETFKLSKDPLFIDKVRDIVGLYMNPPDRAMVLCVDEKSQIQVLDRTSPLLPMRPGQLIFGAHEE